MNTNLQKTNPNYILNKLLEKEAKPPAQKLVLPTIKPKPIIGLGKELLPNLNPLPMQGGHFEIFKDVAGQYRFRLRGPNNEPILASEGYTTKQNCIKGINAIKRYSLNATTKDYTS